MPTNKLGIHSTYLATKDRLADRFLATGKVVRPDLADGFFIYLIEVISPWSSAKKIEDIITQAIGSISGDENESLDAFFERALMKINERLDLIARKGEREWLGNLNALVGLVVNDQLILSQTGQMIGYIFRKGKISTIIERGTVGSIPMPAETFSEVTRGKLALNDRIVFGNREFYERLSLDRLRHLAEKNSAFVILTELFKYFRGSRVQKANAIILEYFNPETTESEEEENTVDKRYLDEPIETAVSSFTKAAAPVLKTLWHQTKRLSKQTYHGSKQAYGMAKTNWDKTYGPKTKELLKQSKIKLADTSKEAGKNVAPQLKKITQSIAKNKQYKSMSVQVRSYTHKAEKINWLNNIASALGRFAKLLYVFLIQPQNRRYSLGLLILIFVFVGYFKIRANNSTKTEDVEQRAVVSAFDKASNLFVEAKEDAALGKSESATKYLEALSLAQKAQGAEENKDRAAELIRQIQTQIDTSTATHRTITPASLFQLSGNLQAVTFADNEVYGISTEGKIFASDVRDKEAKLLASIGTDNGKVLSLTYSKSAGKLFIYTDQSKVLAFDPITKISEEVKVVEDPAIWEKAIQIRSYVSNVYLLDTENGKVWKHVTREGGYGKGSAYLNSNKTNLKNAVDLSVDGDMYVLRADGTAAHFVKGEYDSSFKLASPPSPANKIDQPAQIIADLDSNFVFILDKGQNRILRFNKSGAFVDQYIFDGLKLDYFSVNSKIQKLYAISEGKVYEMGL